MATTKITLKKARDISRAALDAANQIKLEPTVRFSIHSNREPAVVMSEAAGLFETALQEADNLLDAYYGLRILIGEKNDACGVSKKLTERALLDAREKRLKTTLELIQSADGESDDEVIRAQIKANRDARATGNRYSYDDTITVKVVTAEQVERVASALAGVRRKRSDIQDQIAALNLNQTISVPSEIADTLTRVGIMD